MMKVWEQLLMNVANLFKVKTILSLIVVITMCILTFKGVVDVKEFMIITASIVTYYFTRKTNKNDEE